MADAEPMIETTVWIRVVPKNNTRTGKVTSIEIAGCTKNRPTGKGAYMQMTLRFPRRLFEFPDTALEIEINDSMLDGTPAQIAADLADLRDTLAP